VDRGAVVLAPGPHDGGGAEPENLSSRRLAAKLGFIEEGTLRDWLCVASAFRSVVMYSLLRTDSMTRA
jgi:RimJ/RimL family protein N-acetyltransferase